MVTRRTPIDKHFGPTEEQNLANLVKGDSRGSRMSGAAAGMGAPRRSAITDRKRRRVNAATMAKLPQAKSARLLGESSIPTFKIGRLLMRRTASVPKP